jgi:SAM-dependent methyltransferase
MTTELSIISSIDYLTSRSIRGWCWDFSDKPVKVDFFVGGEFIGSCIANEYRSDLELQSILGGYAAFRFEIPRNYADRHIEIFVGRYQLYFNDNANEDPHIKWRRKRVKFIKGLIGLPNSRGIEFGPLHDPIIDPSERGVIYVDHASTKDLIAKYESDPNVDVREIVEVDFVYSGSELSETINEINSLDYVISSHVGEHIPDFIGWMIECRRVLRSDGLLVIILPDKRFCWDAMRPISRASDLIKAHRKGITRPNLKMIWQAKTQAVSFGDKITWYTFSKPNPHDRFQSVQNTRDLVSSIFRYLVKREYLDVHCWVFSSETFQDLIDELGRQKLCDFEVEAVYGPEGNEFIAVLRPK